MHNYHSIARAIAIAAFHDGPYKVGILIKGAENMSSSMALLYFPCKKIQVEAHEGTES
jgi:hypothetical protein